MKEKNKFVFQIDADCVKHQRVEANFVIEINENSDNKNLCVIYFSSHAIYYPNEKRAFEDSILKKDYYEWRSSVPISAYKQIFVRDVYKQWYISGINNRLSTPPILLRFLKGQTVGYKVITVGSSAGGYAAVLYGCLLKAERVFAFNAQFELNSLLPKGEKVNPILVRKQQDQVAKPYYDLTTFLNGVPVYYFMSEKSDWDKSQKAHVRNFSNVRTISFLTSHHGIPFPKVAIPAVMQSSPERLDRLSGKTFRPIVFSIKFVGIITTLRGLFKQALEMIKRKIE